MPPRRKKGRAQQSSNSGARNARESFYRSPVPYLDNADGWHAVIIVLCDFFKLPDLTTTKGLKKVHSNFDSIYQKLEDFYQENKDDYQIAGGIVGIYAKMCADSLLRNKLFHRGFLDHLIPLVSKPETCHIALRSLNSVTHHSGNEIRRSIGHVLGATLANLLEERKDDPIAAELTIANLSHSLAATSSDATESPITEEIIASFDLKKTIPLVVDICKESRSTHLVNHAFEFLTVAASLAPDVFLAYPPSVDVFVAGLRSKDWGSRLACLAAIIQIHKITHERDNDDFDPVYYMQQLRKGLPNVIQTQMVAYGFARTETMIRLRASADLQHALVDTLQHRDLHKLGLFLAELITRTDYPVTDAVLPDDNHGLPFDCGAEALPYCAKAIRDEGIPSEAELADILDIRYSIMKGAPDRALPMAERAAERYPECAYFYYVICSLGDCNQSLSVAKKGLKCKNITPFLRSELTYMAVDLAVFIGINVLSASGLRGKKQKQKEGTAYLSSALKDAKSYISETPPDARNMKNVLYNLILLTLVIRGPGISPDLREIKSDLKRLQQCEDLVTYIGAPPKKTLPCASQRTITSSYGRAWKEWGDLIEWWDSMNDEDESCIPPVTNSAEEELVSWLEDTTIDTGGKEGTTRFANPNFSYNDVELYTCSWCRNPSAVLRKCSGCSLTRYCDQSCQKSHWQEHKKKCKANTS